MSDMGPREQLERLSKAERDREMLRFDGEQPLIDDLPGTASKSQGRFASFTEAELLMLWEWLCVDDGIRYGLEEGNPEYPLAKEMHDEAMSRGLSGYVWEGVI